MSPIPDGMNMKRRHQIGALTRRQALALVGGFGMVPLSATLAAAAEAAPITTRPIPGTGERLPVVGLGTAYQYATDLPANRAGFGEVVRTLVAGGGSVVDTSSDYGAAETMLGAVLSESGLRPPSVPMKVRHLSPGIFRLEGAEGSSHSCPCSRSRLIQQVAPPRSVCADRRLYRRHPLRHPNSPIARGDGRSLPRTSCAS